LILAFLLLHAVPLFSQARTNTKIGATLTVTESGIWQTIQRGVEYRRIAFERSEPSYALELKLLRLHSQFVVPRILYAGELVLKAGTAKTFAQKTGAIAAINANYFDEKGRPLAYLKTATTEINPTVSKHRLYTGVFGVSASRPFVTLRDEFQSAQAREAVQTGPLLLSRGAPLDFMPGLGRFARRAVIGIDKESRIVIAVTEAVIGGLGFTELQELFGDPKWQLLTPDLLNLDGGGSAQLYIKCGKFEEWLPGTSEVPVTIGFFTRAH
jgi:exopolysaccharide biosynthesis protein